LAGRIDRGRAAFQAILGAGVGHSKRIAERFGDRDLLALALARLGQGQALLRLGRAGDAASLLDEAMASVTAGVRCRRRSRASCTAR
jgi:hypothetical protein